MAELYQTFIQKIIPRFSKDRLDGLTASALARAIVMRGKQPSVREKSVLAILARKSISQAELTEAFPRTASPAKETVRSAALELAKCVLGSSLKEVFLELTPKYRNEAARRKFFATLAEISENLHLSADNSIDEFLASAPSDPVARRVLVRTNELLRRADEILSRWSRHLSELTQEYHAFRKSAENLTGISWQDSDHFIPNLGISAVFDPWPTENEGTMKWGVTEYPELRLINFNPAIVFFDPARRGLAAREAIYHLTPICLEKMTTGLRVVTEQSEYLAYKLLNAKYEKELWRHVRHGLRKETRVRPEALFEHFQTYEMQGGGDIIYREVWRSLRNVKPGELTRQDYQIIFDTIAARPAKRHFSEKELRLLSLLSKIPDISPNQAAKNVKTTIPTTMKLISQLMDKAALIFTIMADMTKVGLYDYLIMFKTKDESKLTQLLIRFPYCRQILRLYGSYDIFAVIDVPTENSAFIQKFLGRLQETGIISNYSLSRSLRDFHTVNFDHYDLSTQQWNLPWDMLGIKLRERLSKDATTMVAESSRISLDLLDLRILDQLRANCRFQLTDIARNLSVSGAYVGKKIKRMISHQVFRPALWPLKVGAEDWGIVALDADEGVCGALIDFLAELPSSRGAFTVGDVNGIIAFVWAPTGEMKQLFKLMDDRIVRPGLARSCLFQSVGEWLLGRWLPASPSPYPSLYSEEGKWIFDENHYLQMVK